MSGLFSAAEAPSLRRLDAGATARDFSHDEIVALAAQYRDWAADEHRDVWRRARLLDWAADCDDIAAWVGPDWRPCQPTGRGLTHSILRTRARHQPPRPNGAPALRLVADNA